MTTALRLLLAVAAWVALTLGVVGFVCNGSVSDSTGFADRMAVALDDPEVRGEVQALLKQEVQEGLDRAVQSGGILGSLTDFLGTENIAERVSATVNTQAFDTAWREWSLLLHAGLVDAAFARSNGDVVVTASGITVAVEPLLQPVLGDLADNAAAILSATDQESTVTIPSNVPRLPELLTRMGQLIDARWALLTIGLGALLVLVLIGPRRLLWSAIGLGGAAILVGATALAIDSSDRVLSAGNGDLDATRNAVFTALTEGWPQQLLAIAAVLAGAAMVAGFGAALIRSRAAEPH